MFIHKEPSCRDRADNRKNKEFKKKKKSLIDQHLEILTEEDNNYLK